MENKRRKMRIPVATIAHITPHGLQKGSEVMVRDLSTEGMGCYVNHACQKGDMMLVKVRLDLPGEDSGVIQATLMAQIMWVKLMSEEKKYAVGLEFRDMESRHPKLYAHLQDLESLTFSD